MEKAARTAVFSAIGAMVGAGFASGREIDSFFSRYGDWSYGGVGCAAAVTLMLTWGVMQKPGLAGMPEAWQGRWLERLWQGMFSALMLTTGGAMLAGAGEIAALMLPVQGSCWLGLTLTAALGAWMAWRGRSAGAWVSAVLTGLMLAIAGAGLALEPQLAAVSAASPEGCALRGASYAGFNMALALPGLATSAKELSARGRRQCAVMLAAVLGLLLLGGNAVLLRHSALRGDAMPFVRLLSAYGKAGYYLCGAALYLAVLTSASAAMRSLWTLTGSAGVMRWLTVAGMMACAGLGFTGVVERVYPLMGALCLGLMTAALLSRADCRGTP